MSQATHNAFSFALHSDSPDQTMAFAAALAGRLRGGDVIALQGQLGSGKTCFVRGLAKGLGVNPSSVSSPTFVICHEYARPGNEGALVHIDAYRLSGAIELESIGWAELLNDKSAIIAVEWPERIATALPASRITVHFSHEGEHRRAISVSAPAEFHDRLASLTATNQPPAAARTCPTCGQPLDESSAHLPFCSARCRMADLNRWFREKYRTSRPVEEDEELAE